MGKQARPHEPKPPKRSAGFNLDSLTDGVAGFLSGYSTVQVKNGTQSILAVRSDTGTAGAPAAPVIPTQINANGVVSLQGTDRQNTVASKAVALAKKTAAFSSGQKLALIGGGAVVLLLGGVVVLSMLRK